MDKFVLSNDPLCILSSSRSVKGRVYKFHSALPIFLTAAIAATRMGAMAIAMAIARARLMEQFVSDTAKLFRLGGILALRWHFGPPLAFQPTLANLLAL